MKVLSRINKNKISGATSVLVGLLLISTSFQNCSDVNFSKSESNASLGCPVGQTAGPGGLCGSLQTRVTTTDIQAPISKIDILLVVDNSGSMDLDLERLSTKLAGFINLLEGSGLDWQACYTTTDVSNSGAKGAALAWKSAAGASTNEIVLNRNSAATTADLDQRFQRSIKQFATLGSGSGREQGVAAINRSLDVANNAPCFRTDAALTSIVISDEDERSCGGRTNVPEGIIQDPKRTASSYTGQCTDLVAENMPANLVAKIQSQFGVDKNYLHHSLVIPPQDNTCWESQDQQSPVYYGVTYANLTSLTGGILGNICADDYATELQDISDNISQSLSAVSLDCAPNDLLSVKVNNAMASPSTYALAGNKVTFNPALAQGTHVEITYTCVIGQ